MSADGSVSVAFAALICSAVNEAGAAVLGAVNVAAADEDDPEAELEPAGDDAALDDEGPELAALLLDELLELDDEVLPELEPQAVSTKAPTAARDTAVTRKVFDLLTELITPILLPRVGPLIGAEPYPSWR